MLLIASCEMVSSLFSSTFFLNSWWGLVVLYIYIARTSRNVVRLGKLLWLDSLMEAMLTQL